MIHGFSCRIIYHSHLCNRTEKKLHRKNIKWFGSALCLAHLLFFFPYQQIVRQYFNLTSHRQLHNRIDTLYQCSIYFFNYVYYSVYSFSSKAKKILLYLIQLLSCLSENCPINLAFLYAVLWINWSSLILFHEQKKKKAPHNAWLSMLQRLAVDFTWEWMTQSNLDFVPITNVSL